MRYFLHAIVLGALYASSAPAAMPQRPLSTIYDLYLGGMLAGELSISAIFQGDHYSASSVMRTAGVVGALYRASFQAETEGRRASSSQSAAARLGASTARRRTSR